MHARSLHVTFCVIVAAAIVGCSDGGSTVAPMTPPLVPTTPTPIAPPTVAPPTPTPAPSPLVTPLPTSTPIQVPITIPTPTPIPAAPPVFGAPFFVGGGSGDCATGLTFGAPAQSADIALSEPGYTGAFHASSSSPTANASVANSVLTITALGAGSAQISVSDVAGNTATCSVTVQ